MWDGRLRAASVLLERVVVEKLTAAMGEARSLPTTTRPAPKKHGAWAVMGSSCAVGTVLESCTSAKYGEPAGARTRDPRLKRAMLYQLSYRLTERRARILPPTLVLCLARPRWSRHP